MSAVYDGMSRTEAARVAAKDIIDVAGRVTGCGNPDRADSHGPALRPLSP